MNVLMPFELHTLPTPGYSSGPESTMLSNAPLKPKETPHPWGRSRSYTDFQFLAIVPGQKFTHNSDSFSSKRTPLLFTHSGVYFHG